MRQSKWAPPSGHDPRRNHGQSGTFNKQRLFGSPNLVLSSPTTFPPLDYGGADMAVCTFFQRGTCKFGGSQRDANRGGGGGGGFGGANTNRFNAFGGGGGGGDRYRTGQQSGGSFGSNRGSGPARFNLQKDDIKSDLTDQRPIYPFSCYGPGREAPRQLIEGPVEISPEELRARYYSQGAAGNVAAAQQEEGQLYSKTEEQIKMILNDLDGAIKYVEDGADVHPNRSDATQDKTVPPSTTGGAPSSNPFSNPPANPFGGGNQTQSSAFGKPANPFAQPSNPSQTTSAFGQASTFGASAGFGKPSMPGSAFGQTSAIGGGSAFGKPSMLGGGGGSAFGQTSSLGQQSAFGQPSKPGTSTFGQPPAPGATSTFGQASAPAQTSAFGQKNALGQNTAFSKPGFGQTAFGQTSQPAASANPFGGGQAQVIQASPFGQAQKPNPFGKPQTQTVPAPANPFGGGGTTAPQTTAFGQPGLANPSPFGATQSTTPAAPTANPFATVAQAPAATPSAFPTQNQPANPFSQPPAQQTPSPFGQQGQPAVAQQGHQLAAPGNGASAGATDPFKEGRPENYEGEQGQKLQEIYRRVAQIGVFNPNEDIPLVPPKCDWIVSIL
ncbi:hypothetical protein N0V90_002749 [Kalmusia sp. IMI 367209]|nr:hypothetical protein N0V90_002749 [Kalmusia sp. IMI 367209]